MRTKIEAFMEGRRIFEHDLEVRGYELDSFGHVNHAVYISYAEHARWKMLKECDIDMKRFNGWKRFPVIAALEAQYLKPSYLGDILKIRSQVIEHGTASFKIVQRMVRIKNLDGEPKSETVFEYRVQVVMVDEKGRPAESPEGLEVMWAPA